MSKVDAQRAMREAKYARSMADGAARRRPPETKSGLPAHDVAPAATAVPELKAPRSAAARTTELAKPAAAAPASEGALCGHTSMNGRSCTRAANHAEKSHRYG